MSKTKRVNWGRRALLLVVMLVPTAGCDPALIGTSFAALAAGPLALTNAAAFAAGWLARDVTFPTTTNTQCYRNGEAVDCGEIAQ